MFKYIISHRGNLNGPNDKENHPDYLLDAVVAGFDIELDIWYINNRFILGHDKPQYEVDQIFLNNISEYAWCHAKNIQAAYQMSKLKTDNNSTLLEYFYHNIDDCTLTSSNYIWTYPGKELTKQSIAVMPEMVDNWNIKTAIGVCTDYPKKHKQQA